MGTKICHITISDASHERRLNNQFDLARETGRSSLCFALFRENLPEKENINGTGIHRIKIRHPEGGVLKFIEFNVKLFIRLLKSDFDILHVHDLWVLPAAGLFSIFRNKYIIYDAHEFYMGLEIFKNRKIKKIVWYLAERIFITRVKALITVSEPLRRLYLRAYPCVKNISSIVLRNVPSLRDTNPERKVKTTGIINKQYLIFQGIFKPGRGLTQLIRAMEKIDDIPLIMVGYGELEEQLKKEVKDRKLENKVVFTGKVNQEEYLNYTQNAYLGLVLFEPDSINYRYALPNKFFEYIHAGIPVICSDIITFRHILKDFEVGVLVNPWDVGQIVETVRSLLQNSIRYEQLKRNCLQARNMINWENEKIKLDLLYQKK
ncbi:MAG: glycosyltransferase [Calditrichia bacterium]